MAKGGLGLFLCSAGTGGGLQTVGDDMGRAEGRRGVHTSDAVNTQYTTSALLATLAYRNTASSTLQTHNNKSDTSNAQQYMKDMDAYDKRKLMRPTKGDEKVVCLPWRK